MPAGLRKADTRTPCQKPTWSRCVRITGSFCKLQMCCSAYEEGAGGGDEDVAAGLVLANGPWALEGVGAVDVLTRIPGGWMR